jgi:hypothetical protein
MPTLAELHPQPQTGLDPVPQTPPSTGTTTTATTATAATCGITHASSSSCAAPTNENENDKTAALEAANVAFFDALGHDVDKRHPEAADGADRLAHALRRVLALDENTTSVLDYACGSGNVQFSPHLPINALTNSSSSSPSSQARSRARSRRTSRSS